MSPWFKHYWATQPNANPRINGLVLDLTRTDTQKFNNAQECAVNAVHEIVQTHPGPYTLLVSGGIDSQAMMHVWALSGVPHNVVHYSYNWLNYHDTECLRIYCHKHGITHQERIFDANAFISGPDLIPYAQKYDCSSPQILSYIRMIQNHDETVILSGNTYNNFNIGVNYTHLALDRYRAMEKPNLVPFFFSSTPSITFLVDYLDNNSHQNYNFKVALYEALGAQVRPQTRAYTGFERIKELYETTEVPLNLRYKYKDRASKSPFDVLYRYRLYDYIGLYTEFTYIKR